jgi:hypothetical protein
MIAQPSAPTVEPHLDMVGLGKWVTKPLYVTDSSPEELVN